MAGCAEVNTPLRGSRNPVWPLAVLWSCSCVESIVVLCFHTSKPTTPLFILWVQSAVLTLLDPRRCALHLNASRFLSHSPLWLTLCKTANSYILLAPLLESNGAQCWFDFLFFIYIYLFYSVSNQTKMLCHFKRPGWWEQTHPVTVFFLLSFLISYQARKHPPQQRCQIVFQQLPLKIWKKFSLLWRIKIK